MEGLGNGYEAFVERLQSNFVATAAAKDSNSSDRSNQDNASASHGLHLPNSSQSRFISYPFPHAYTGKTGEKIASESLAKASSSLSTELPMQESATSPVPNLNGQSQVPNSEQSFSADVTSMPDRPQRRGGHRRAQSEIAFHLPDNISFEQEYGIQGTEFPSFSDDIGEDMFSLCADMEKYSSYDASSSALQFSRKDEPYITTTVHHARSVSMDGSVGGVNESRDFIGGGGQSNIRRIRHQHSNSMDGAMSFNADLLRGDQDSAESKKALAMSKLAELSLVDPKRAKRILANRQSAARSKERKMRYIGELERNVQTLQTEATSLSAQLAMLQRDTLGLSTENNELKLRLQSVEQQAQLRDALNSTLKEEVQRLRSATGHWMQSGIGSQQLSINPHVLNHFTPPQLEQYKPAQTPLNNHHFCQHQHQYSEFSYDGTSGSGQGNSGSFGESFTKSEPSNTSVSQESNGSSFS